VLNRTLDDFSMPGHVSQPAEISRISTNEHLFARMPFIRQLARGSSEDLSSTSSGRPQYYNYCDRLEVSVTARSFSGFRLNEYCQAYGYMSSLTRLPVRKVRSTLSTAVLPVILKMIIASRDTS